eukprot:gene5829-11769_t
MVLIQLPLSKLLLKGVEWNWITECENSFMALKQSLTTECVRRYPDPKRPFELHTDASDYAIGAVLVQRNDEGVEQPLEYFSRSLSPAESNYTVTEKECLAIVASVKRFYVHLACAPFDVFTDHQALVSLLTMKDSTRRIVRWLITLGEYPFIAVYRKGSLNGDLTEALAYLSPNEQSAPLLDSTDNDAWAITTLSTNLIFLGVCANQFKACTDVEAIAVTKKCHNKNELKSDSSPDPEYFIITS